MATSNPDDTRDSKRTRAEQTAAVALLLRSRDRSTRARAQQAAALALLPRSRGGTASATTNPRSITQQDRLERFLRTKTRQTYEARLSDLAARYGVTATGRVTDPVILFKLQHRAAFASNSIRSTLEKEIARTQVNGGTLADLVQARAAYKPQQVFATETSWAANAARRDFFENHPDLAAQATVHAEPLDAQEEECESAVAAGSVPADAVPLDFPAHVNCQHEWVPDDVPPDMAMLPAGTMTSDGTTIDEPVTVSTATAQTLNGVGWWLAGMTIQHATGDTLHGGL